MKYQALRPHFFSVGGWGWWGGGSGVGWGLVGGMGVLVGGMGGVVHGVLMRDVVGGGGRLGGGMGDGVLSGSKGGWCAMGIIIFKGVLTNKIKFFNEISRLSKFINLMNNLKYEH